MEEVWNVKNLKPSNEFYFKTEYAEKPISFDPYLKLNIDTMKMFNKH